MPAQDAYSGDIDYAAETVGTYSDMDISDDYETEDYGELEISEILGITEDTIIHEELEN